MDAKILSQMKSMIKDLTHRSMALELAVARGLITREQVGDLLTEVSGLVDTLGPAEAWNAIPNMTNKYR